LLDLELGPDRPDMILPQRWLGACQLPFVPGHMFGCRGY
jgi:hypothetical protein